MKVYHLTYDHQLEPQDYGLFNSLEKAENYLKNTLRVDVSSPTVYYEGILRIYKGEYRIEEKRVG